VLLFTEDITVEAL